MIEDIKGFRDNKAVRSAFSDVNTRPAACFLYTRHDLQQDRTVACILRRGSPQGIRPNAEHGRTA